MKTLITNIRYLLMAERSPRLIARGSEMADVAVIENAWLLIDGELIADFGCMDVLPDMDGAAFDEFIEIDADGNSDAIVLRFTYPSGLCRKP